MSTSHSNPNRAFTLIELLIVVAIIAILAAIAVPNFLEAQVRAKISRAKSDIRTYATGMESYHVDYNVYPENPPLNFPTVITTPVAYLSSLPFDVFYKDDPNINLPPFPGLEFFIRLYPVGAAPPIDPQRYAILSRGPDTDIDVYFDGVLDPIALFAYPGYSPEIFSDAGIDLDLGAGSANYRYELYDPTNGSISSGDVWRVSDHGALN